MNNSILRLERKLFFRNKIKLMILFLLSGFLVVDYYMTINEQQAFSEQDLMGMQARYLSIIDLQKSYLVDSKGNSEIQEQNNQILTELIELENLLFDYLRLKNTYLEIDSHSVRVKIVNKLQGLSEKNGVMLMDSKELVREEIYFHQLEEYQLDRSFNNEGISGGLFLLKAMKFWFSFAGLLILVLLFYDVWSKENAGSYRLLFTQPVLRINVLYSKLFFVFMSSFWLLIAIMLIAFSIGAIVKGVGSLDYPILLEMENKVRTVSLQSFLMQVFTLGLFNLFLFSSLLKFLDSFFKHNAIVLLTMLLLILVALGLDNLLLYNNYFPLNLFLGWKFLIFNGTIEYSYSIVLAIITQVTMASFLLKLSNNKKLKDFSKGVI